MASANPAICNQPLKRFVAKIICPDSWMDTVCFLLQGQFSVQPQCFHIREINWKSAAKCFSELTEVC